MAPSAKELFAVAQRGQSLEDQLALLAPVEHVQPRDEEWAEAMASLAWMCRATNDDATAIRCADLVVNTQPRGSVWRAQCEVLRAEIANRNREPIDTDGLVDAVQLLSTSAQLAAAYEGAFTLADAFCEAKKLAEAEQFARNALSTYNACVARMGLMATVARPWCTAIKESRGSKRRPANTKPRGKHLPLLSTN